MKNLLKLIVLITVFGVIFIACGNDDNPTEPDNGSAGITSIGGTIADWNLGTATIKLVADTEQKLQYVAGEAVINSNGEFNISSLKDVPADYLYPLRYDIPSGVTLSDMEVNTIGAYLPIFVSGNEAGEVTFGKGSNFPPEAGDFASYYYFADRAATITGSASWSEDGISYQATFDISMVKGWNIFYEIFESYNFSTNEVSVKYISSKPDGGSWFFSY